MHGIDSMKVAVAKNDIPGHAAPLLMISHAKY